MMPELEKLLEDMLAMAGMFGQIFWGILCQGQYLIGDQTQEQQKEIRREL